MATTLSGPMFEPHESEYRRSIHGKSGGHYNVFAFKSADLAADFLRKLFPTGDEAGELNFVLFSTSGVHGSYTTIEEIEADIAKHGPEDSHSEEDYDDERCYAREVTVLLVQPRLVSMTYGEAACRTLEDCAYLKRLRASSWKAAAEVGAPA